MTKNKIFNVSILLVGFSFLLSPVSSFAQTTTFNPNFIISDTEIQDVGAWNTIDIQQFLESKGSYLRNFTAEDVSGTPKKAADIIYDAAKTYQINPKFLLVTLQKEQSLVTDDSPSQKQLDWATGYAVCDSCSMSDPDIQDHKGFGKQVDNAAGLMRWYYDNKNQGFVKKKDVPTIIDGTEVIPQSWATAFLYTYTPHFHGNQNFRRIWDTWFSQIYPDGSLLKAASSTETWLIQNGQKRKFKSQTVLISRADPKMIITVPDVELDNYPAGPEISFSNYSILRVGATTYLLDYDTLRPFASDEVVRQLGYNPQEIDEVTQTDIAGYTIGTAINADTTAPQGVIYQITDLNNSYYLLKDSILTPITDKRIVDVNYKTLKIEKHKLKDLTKYEVANLPSQFQDGTLLKIDGSNKIYVMEKGKKRRIADDDTFTAIGYKKSNVVTISMITASNIFDGEPIYLNAGLLSSKNKFLGDNEAPVSDLFGIKKSKSYLVAEYPSGKIIAGKDIDTRRPIASLTKLLTAYEALSQDYNLKKTTTYKKASFASYDNPLKLVDGEKLNNKDIFASMLISSVNNAARMVAKSTGLSEGNFIDKMNNRLEDWGADNTTLADVTGLSDKNVSTPRDLLKIFTKVLGNATIKDTISETEYSFKELVNKNSVKTHYLKTTNKIVTIPGRNYRVLGSKTGYTDEAGAVLIMHIESKVNKKQYVIITMGNSDYNKRFDEPNSIGKWIAAGKVKIAVEQ